MSGQWRAVPPCALPMLLVLAGAGAGCGSSAPQPGGTSRPTEPGSSAPAATGKASPGGALTRLTPATVESQISQLQQRTGLSVKAVRCPKHGQISNGHTFTCVTTLSRGQSVTTHVTPTNAALGLARFQFSLPRGAGSGIP